MPISWPYRTPGIPDREFERIPGIPLTPREVRVLFLSQLRLPPRGCLWDIGAGTGTIAVEAGLLCPDLQIVAIERDEDVVDLIRRNCGKFGVTNVEIVQGNAPECLAEISTPPDRICLEGGKAIGQLLADCWGDLNRGGRLVAVASSLETLYAVSEGFAQVRARQIEVIQSAINRLETKGLSQKLVPLEPMFLLSGEKMD
ncbi:precorrin-6Y C5,15-methyltransferase subunit CbiT [Synechococcus sp. PCC 7336]|uniref:precorrin-6Y C5,15-methyltransferase subunit CbiT n=1 Tax=Synechococcus sp. PCC 7336 TaxID=195250 RepID=UPI000349EC4C|nr:precorrin-6Y C5,15-methyltransferase subunit CbiT [Synechococcus sp. PCC 7336]